MGQWSILGDRRRRSPHRRRELAGDRRAAAFRQRVGRRGRVRRARGHGFRSCRPGRTARAPPKRNSKRALVEWGILIVVAIVIAIIIKAFLFQAFYIPSASMEPTLKIGDRVLVNKLSYDLHDLHRGDIVVFAAEPNTEWHRAGIDDLVKRVIALPGETITQCETNRVCIDGKLLKESYLPKTDGKVIDTILPTSLPQHHRHLRARTVMVCDARQPQGWLQGPRGEGLRDGRQPHQLPGRPRQRTDQGIEHRRPRLPAHLAPGPHRLHVAVATPSTH